MEILLFSLLSLLWGGSFIAIQSVVAHAPPLLSGAARSGAALALLLVLLPLLRKPVRVPARMLGWVWLCGLFAQGIPFSLLFWAEQRISPGLAGIFNGTVPIWTYLLGWAFMPGAEPPSRRKLLGVGMGLLGIVMIFAPKLAASASGAGGADSGALLGTLAVWGMALSYSVGTLLNRRIFAAAAAPGAPKVEVSASTLQQCVASLAYLGALSLAFETWPAAGSLPSPARYAGGILYLGWLSTAIAFLIYFRLIRSWGAVRASTVTYVVPVVALALDFLFNGNLPSLSELLGTLTILGGVVLIQRSNSVDLKSPLMYKQAATKLATRG